MSKRMLLVVGLALLAAVGAWAYPTLGGPTGLVQVPTSDVVPAATVDVAVDFLPLPGDMDAWAVRGLMGLSQNAELGVAWTRVSNSESGSLLGFNGKMRLRSEPSSFFGLAVGASFEDPSGDLFSGVDSAFQAYLAASKDLTRATADLASAAVRARGHVGLLYNNSDDDSSLRPFFGLDFTSPEGAQLVLEYQSRADDDVSSVALRYPLTPSITGQVGLTNFSGDEHKVVIGATYRWGLGVPGY